MGLAKTALWMRQVAAAGLVQVNWKLFSLHIVNAGHDYATDAHTFGYKAETLLMAARRRAGNPAVEQLYMALGDALPGRRGGRAGGCSWTPCRGVGLPESLLRGLRQGSEL